MKKLITTLLCGVLSTTAFGQWSKTALQGEQLRPNVDQKGYYSLDLNAIRGQLSNAQEQGKGATAVIIKVPTLDGKIERFAVYSFPVVEKSLADKYQLGSYVGTGIDDPSKLIRFSVSPYDFQSMITKNGQMEFVEPANTGKTVYGVHPKTNKNAGPNGNWMCTSDEDILSKNQVDQLFKSGKNQNSNVSLNRASDKKYRTMRLAMTTNGEYTQYFGGVPQALAQINATLTRCNGVFERDFALHLILQDYPSLIYTDPATDPFTTATPSGVPASWNLETQKAITGVVGEANYDIGHMFGAFGGGGNAGCIGCVCISPALNGNGVPTNNGKGSGITSPADGKPFGDNFDIDYVAHEMGHQLGANHTFSMSLEGTGQNVEPGSGSTIMGYAGITGATDVQPHSDAYFHINSIIQVQNNLGLKTCDIETPINNNPPVITPMADVTIPKSTAFILKAQATDSEADPITYTWEQTDNATTTTNKNNLGTLTSGPNFRSWTGTADPTRYFPKFATVLAGNVKNVNQWEAASTVARTMNFKVTVRDNNPDPVQQQTAFGTQKVVVGSDGPFKVTATRLFNNATGPLTWDVANTNLAPYNVENVKIDYSTDNGVTWIVLAESTPNDGVQDFQVASLATGASAHVRISAIGNVFYAVSKLLVTQILACDGSAPLNVLVSDIGPNTATLAWDPISGATYTVRYRKVGDTTPWIEVAAASPQVVITGLEEATEYEYQVAAICSGTTGTYTQLATFTTGMLAYCSLTSTNSNDEWISNVTVTSEGGTTMTSNSGKSNYTDYTSDPARTVTLYAGSTANTISVAKTWSGSQFNEAITVWIDFNRNGVFEATEMVMKTAANKTTPETKTFSVPADAYTGVKPLRMRVALQYNAALTNPCGTYTYGEVEDYAVVIPSSLGVNDVTKAQGLEVYPNPTTDILNISNTSKNATYTIHNAAGQLVSKGAVADGKVNVSQFAKGVYVITVNNNGKTSSVKFIKK